MAVPASFSRKFMRKIVRNGRSGLFFMKIHEKNRTKWPFWPLFHENSRENRTKWPFRPLFMNFRPYHTNSFMNFREKEAGTAISYDFLMTFREKEAGTAISYDFSHEFS